MSNTYLPQFDVMSDSFDRLPRVCLANKAVTGEPIRLLRGVSGYFKVHPSTDVDRFNNERGITEAQVEAMMIGSVCGWEVPGADPNTWETRLALKGE